MYRSSLFRRRNEKDPIWAMPDDTGYGHSSYGHSGYGHSDYGHYETVYCCPLTIDPYTWAALLSFIALGTYLLNQTIQMSMLGGRRKRDLKRFGLMPMIKAGMNYLDYCKNQLES